MSDKRILIIDRDTPSRERLRRQFSGRGWSVALAATVAEARARLDPPPHCILLELALGDDPGAFARRYYDATAIYFADATSAAAFVARWCSVSNGGDRRRCISDP